MFRYLDCCHTLLSLHLLYALYCMLLNYAVLLCKSIAVCFFNPVLNFQIFGVVFHKNEVAL